MKLKGIKPIEQHVDKIVIGGVAVVFLGAVAWQVLPSKGSEIKVGQTTVSNPGQAFRPVEEAARKLADNMQASLTPPAAPGFTLGDKLAIGAQTPRPKRSIPVALGPAPGGISIVGAGTLANAAYAAPTLPTPVSQMAHAFQSTISPVEYLRFPELAKFLPTQQPFDKGAISIQASFNGTALRDALQADPDGATGPLEPVPISWWRDPVLGRPLVSIINVQVERQTLRNPDGTTPPEGASITITSVPGRFDMLKAWTESVKSAGDVPPMLETASQAAEVIQRPPYFQTIAGPAWMPPAQAATAADPSVKDREIRRKTDRLAELTQTANDVRARLGAAGPTSPRGEDRRQPPTPQGGGKSGAGGNRPPTAPTAEPAANRTILERRLADLDRQIDALTKELEELRGVPAAASNASGVQGALETSLFDATDVKVWSHDLTAVPGAAYRYRVRVAINNPLFGRNLQEAQKDLAGQSLTFSPWSDWTDEVSVDLPEYYFVVNAQDQDQLTGRPRASAQVFKFYYGFYRSANVGIEPGDMIVGTMDVPDTLKLADMDKLKGILAGDAPPAGSPLPGATPPPAPTGRETVPGAPRGGPRGMAPPQTTPGAAPNAPAPTTPIGETPDWLSVPVPTQLRMSVDALLLDVNRVPSVDQLSGGGADRFQAVLRDFAGRLQVRFPDQDRGQALFKRLDASAKAGENQGVAPVEPIKPTDRPLQQPPRGGERPPPPPPRTGGGGG